MSVSSQQGLMLWRRVVSERAFLRIAVERADTLLSSFQNVRVFGKQGFGYSERREYIGAAGVIGHKRSRHCRAGCSLAGRRAHHTCSQLMQAAGLGIAAGTLTNTLDADFVDGQIVFDER